MIDENSQRREDPAVSFEPKTRLLPLQLVRLRGRRSGGHFAFSVSAQHPGHPGYVLRQDTIPLLSPGASRRLRRGDDPRLSSRRLPLPERQRPGGEEDDLLA